MRSWLSFPDGVDTERSGCQFIREVAPHQRIVPKNMIHPGLVWVGVKTFAYPLRDISH